MWCVKVYQLLTGRKSFEYEESVIDRGRGAKEGGEREWKEWRERWMGRERERERSK